ncbi:uncharacterized protein [Haliotis cracherodii]|uniref:uncharacterized protein n=1 Tax=Haliotis cracherodii TaxID=6455 RepID=UPI0039EA23F0
MASSEGGGTSKTITAGSQTAGSGSAKGAPALRRRRTRIASEKKIADDEYMAAAIGDVEWLKQSLREIGGHINYDKNGLTALHLAAIHGRLECLKLCIDKFKFDLNLPSTTGWRAVHLAISNQTGKRSLICLTYLLDKGADSSICNDDGISPVHQAASEGHVQCLKLLIERGAKVDGKDCRGNTPLDLAKLWGHRKCARILAAEVWHQDKDHVAREMTQLKKVRMQQILQELEEEEEVKAAQEFYGDQAFRQWLGSRHLEEKPTGPDSQRPPQHGLYRPNSQTLQRQTGKMKVSMVNKTPSSLDKRADTDTSLFTEETTEDQVHFDDSMSKMDDFSGVREHTMSRSISRSRSRSKSPGYINPNQWIFSAKLSEKDYVPNLKDEYPRNEYTMMPETGSGPKYYEGKHIKYVEISEVDPQMKELKKKKLRKPDLPKEIVDRVLNKNLTPHDRPFQFKPKHIHDIHTKKKYEDDVKPKSEMPLHMSHDLRSHLVKRCLSVPLSLSAKSRPLSGVSDWMLDTFPREMVVHTMKQMSRRQYFPNVKGAEYVLNMGDLKGV